MTDRREEEERRPLSGPVGAIARGEEGTDGQEYGQSDEERRTCRDIGPGQRK